jgi:hypothetical protein
MSSITQVQKLYQDVINDVVKNLKQEFESEGIDDTVLQHLQNVCDLLGSVFAQYSYVVLNGSVLQMAPCVSTDV